MMNPHRRGSCGFIPFGKIAIWNTFSHFALTDTYRRGDLFLGMADEMPSSLLPGNMLSRPRR
jgi:hypothetical protein